MIQIKPAIKKSLLILLILAFHSTVFSFGELYAQSNGPVEYIGHRGARGIFPENSIEGFQLALSKGAVILEMDLAVSKDRQVILSHDPVISRDMCFPSDKERSEKDDKEVLFELDYDSIKSFKCGEKGNEKFPLQERASVCIPLLSAVIDSSLEYARRNDLAQPYFQMELKNSKQSKGYYPEIDEYTSLVLSVLSEKQILDRTVLTSFDADILKAIRKKSPEVKLGLNVINLKGYKGNVKRLGFKPAYYCVYHKLITKRLVRRASERGTTVCAWTVNNSERFEKLREKGVNSFISDFPDIIK